MGVFFKRLMMAGATMLAGYAMKKMMASLESRAEMARTTAEAQRDAHDVKEFKRLKQDPATGVYYAED